MRRALGVFVLLVIMLWLYTMSHAQEHRHPTETITGATGRFYESWRMPHNRTASCCSRADCYAVEAHMRAGVWFFKHRETGRMLPVPADRVEQERDNPDGQNHACASPQGMVYCFIAGGGT